MTMMDEVSPIFNERAFHFIEPVPKHIEATDGMRATTNDRFALTVMLFSDYCHRPLALDVPDMDMARLLVEARVNKQLAMIKLYGRTENIFIRQPDNSFIQVYLGWHA
jgi:hypothetical protein